ncbi:MAG TPA: 1-pyrroline-5-carboxylate dehydrogenase, partial [Burkholderiales bacterium]|nr:1-pyrroline-5-carboxylate dehydrogenase [Burkholderiales bacterium]
MREAIRSQHRAPEADAVARLRRLQPDDATSVRITETALRLTRRVRDTAPGALSAESFLRSYGLTTREGVALMCVAEALLRIPDADTQDALIRDKLAFGNWSS